jgi:drug/metabolite transporter (DMT)-like permease
MRIASCTALALVAFAANSVLCRVALGGELIDPVSFTVIRLASGALVLLPLARFARTGSPVAWGTWTSGACLLAYAIAFSLAYRSLSTGTGALILFGVVQVTMLVSAWRGGERPGLRQWCGIAAASGGLVYLVAPGVAAPDPVGAGLMALAGVAWGAYSLRGRRMANPVVETAGNFWRASAMAVPLAGLALLDGDATRSGLALAVTSGAATSGLGYVVWYRALPHLTATRAAVVQLFVPALAALGGVLLLEEAITVRLLVASVALLGGIGVVVTTRRATA